MNPYEMNMKLIFEAVADAMLDDRKFKYYSEETAYREESLERRIENIIGLDEEFKYQFVTDLYLTFEFAATEAFKTGLQVGLSMLSNLLTAKVPEIHVIKKEPEKESLDAPVIGETDCLEAFRKYMNDAADKLTDYEKKQIQSKTEYLIEEHRKQINGLS